MPDFIYVIGFIALVYFLYNRKEKTAYRTPGTKEPKEPKNPYDNKGPDA